jgi:hypothetical protein
MGIGIPHVNKKFVKIVGAFRAELRIGNGGTQNRDSTTGLKA